MTAATGGARAAQGNPAPEDFLGSGHLEDGIGLCLSGGGYRAMLFHLGCFLRLNEGGLLPRIDRVASVSGGSLAAGALAVAWGRLAFDEGGVASNMEVVADPVLRLAGLTIDVPCIALGLLPFVHAANLAAWTYDRLLFGGRTLQDLPDRPRFVFTATSLQTGALWRFSKDYAAEWRVGEWRSPTLPIAKAVGASAAFPPYLSPMVIRPGNGQVLTQPGTDLDAEGFGDRLVLTDGGVYDNLGLEPVWKRYRTLLVSDGGGLLVPTVDPSTGWLGQAVRATDIALQQGINMRMRVLRGLAAGGQRTVVYWSLPETARRTHDRRTGAVIAAAVPTRLRRLGRRVQDALVTTGYESADAALKHHGLGLVAEGSNGDVLRVCRPGDPRRRRTG